MRFNTNVGLKSRGRFTLGDFRGVDLTSSPLQIATSRAAECYNLIPENGILRKRPGWEALFQVRNLNDSNFASINGIYPYNQDGEEVLLVHAGCSLICFSPSSDGKLARCYAASDILKDTRSQCFYNNDKAFIVGAGEPVVYGKHAEEERYSAKKIGEIAYVPTTRVLDLEDGASASIDAVNTLTPWRKNEVKIPNGIGIGVGFLLDGAVDVNTEISVTIFLDQDTFVQSEVTLKETGDEKGYFNVDGKTYEYKLSVKNKDFFGGVGAVSFDCVNSETKVVVMGTTAIVTFSSTVEGYHERVANCRFGAAFGTDGKANRLFMSGNNTHQSREWWSEYDDFTYFPDGNTMEVGSAGSAITGFARISDNTMAIFKDGHVGDASIYYCTGQEVTVTDEVGATHKEAIFPATAGTAGEGLLTPFGVANLSGDVLMLGREGVYGIELSSNVASVERYQRERSRAILGDLRRRSFTDAAMAVHKGRLYLAPHDGSGICYVADSRYRASFEGADAGYEWWAWDHIPARVFATWHDTLLFGDEKGRVCAFKEGTFADSEMISFSNADVGFDNEKRVFYHSDAMTVENGDHITFNYELFSLLFENATLAEDGKINIPNDEKVYLQMYEGMKVWVDNAEGSGLNASQGYLVQDLDVGALTFSLVAGGGAVMKPTKDGFRLSVPFTEAVVCDADAVEQEFSLRTPGNFPIIVIDFDAVEPDFAGGNLISHTPVVATWISGMYDLGTYMERKTLLGLSVATASDCGTVRFGFETAKSEAAWQARGIKGFDFNDIDFDNFTFLAPFAGSMTKRMNVRNFNFIRFLYRSEGDEDCAVAGMTVLYKINQTNRGMF